MIDSIFSTPIQNCNEILMMIHCGYVIEFYIICTCSSVRLYLLSFYIPRSRNHHRGGHVKNQLPVRHRAMHANALNELGRFLKRENLFIEQDAKNSGE